MRYTEDKRANYEKATIVRNGELQSVLAKDIRKGDFIFYEKDSKFLVDSLLVGSSNVDGSCHIDTAELDGYSRLASLYLFYQTIIARII